MISSTTVHRTRHSEIPLAREDESKNSGNMDEPFRVVDDHQDALDDHHALDGVEDDDAVPPFEDDFPNADDAFLHSGSEAKGEDDENDERDADPTSVYDLYKKLSELRANPHDLAQAVFL